MNRYKEISFAEMRDFLKAEKGWTQTTQGKEYVFEYAIPSCPGIVVRVFTSVHVDTNTSRSCGQDAIRVCAANKSNNSGWIKSRRCYRTKNWRDNLKDRVTDVIQQSVGRYKRVMEKTPASIVGK